MKEGFSYLVIHTGHQNPSIMEFKCLQVTEVACKIENVLRYGVGLFGSSKYEWLLKTDFDKIGQTKYQILEEFISNKIEEEGDNK